MTKEIKIKRVWWAALLAGLASAAANAVLYFVFEALGAIPPDIIVPDAGQPITVIPVMFASFIPAIPAGIILALLAAFASKPVKIFLVITVVFTVLSFYTPFTIPEVVMPMILALNLMHIVAAVLIAWLLVKLSRQPVSN